MDEIMDRIQEILPIDEEKKQDLRNWFIIFSCCSEKKTARDFAEMIFKEIDKEIDKEK